jgi:hypothetical protein
LRRYSPGFDRPIYTNTFYPFPLDPPRALRRGIWTKSTDKSTTPSHGGVV